MEERAIAPQSVGDSQKWRPSFSHVSHEMAKTLRAAEDRTVMVADGTGVQRVMEKIKTQGINESRERKPAHVVTCSEALGFSDDTWMPSLLLTLYLV